VGRAGQQAAGSDSLSVVTERLLGDRHDETVDAVCAAVFARFPVYAGLRDGAGYRRAVSKLVQLHCATVAGRRRLTPTEIVTLHVIGAQRAREGVPEDDMVGSVRAAMAAGWGRVVDLLAETCETPSAMADVLKELYELHTAFGEEVQAGLCSGFRSEVDQRLPSHVRAQAAVVDRLLEGTGTDDELYAHARQYGVPLPMPLAPLLVTGIADPVELRKAANRVAGTAPETIEGVARTTGTPAHVVLVATEAEADARPMLLERVRLAAEQDDVVVVAGRPAEQPSSFEPAYRQAEADLSCARRARPRGGVVDVEELALYGLLARASPEDRVDFCTRVLGGLLTPVNEELLASIEALARTRWVATTAARAVGVHEQTMRYRLRRIGELSGRKPSDPVDRLLLDVAMRIYRGWLTALADEAGGNA
jgi:hypothetical protein